VSKNAREIKEYIEEIYWGARKRVLLLGHSKGGVDAAAALSLYWPQLKDKVAGLVLAQSPYGGSPVASDILREGQLGDYVMLRKLMEILVSKVLKVFALIIGIVTMSAYTVDGTNLNSHNNHWCCVTPG
jgi:alpha-beta hydrolase superfamily lysophospholipase